MSGRPSTAAVFLREARRSSRRWQTYGLRVAFAGIVFATMGILSSTTELGDPAKSAEFGRTIFLIYSVAQMTIVALLAPLMVGLGVAEERDEGTLQLLLITKLSTVQILWGKVVSRLLVLASFVVGGLPVLALVASFGGVGPWEVLHVTGNTLLVALVLGTLGGVAAMFSGGGAVALGAAALWAFGNWLLLPLAVAGLTGVTGNPTSTLALFSPPAAMFETSWRGFAPLVTNLPVVALLAGLTTPLFRLVTTRSVPSLDGPLENDSELAGVARLQRRVGVMALLVPVFAAMCIAAYVLMSTHAYYAPKGPARATLTALLRSMGPGFMDQFVHGLTYGTAVMMMMLSGAAIALIQLRVSGVLAQVFGGSNATGLLTSTLRAFDAVVRPVRLPVWPLPAAWREVATRGAGGPAVLSRWLVLPLLLGLVFVMCLGLLDGGGQLSWAMGVLMLGATYLMTVLQGVTTFTGERQRRTLGLLLTTTHSMPKLVLGKVVGVMLNTLPWLGIGLTMLAFGSGTQNVGTYYSHYGSDPGSCTFPVMGPYNPLYDVLTETVWAVGLWWAVLGLALLVGLRSRPSRTAFPIVICVVLASPIALAVAIETLHLRVLQDAAFPMFNPPRGWDVCRGNWLTVAFGAGLFGLGSAFMTVLLVRARAWILADMNAS